MKPIDRPGIFKAVPMSWAVRQWPTGSVSISMQFEILEKLEGDTWDRAWSTNYEPHFVFGEFFVVKKDGSVNTVTIEQLARSLAWDGNLATVRTSQAPNYLVQISVEQEEYQGKVRFKAGWMNPGDFTPQAKGVDDVVGKGLEAQFGGLLRAAASGLAKTAKPVKGPERAAEAPLKMTSGEPATDTTPF